MEDLDGWLVFQVRRPPVITHRLDNISVDPGALQIAVPQPMQCGRILLVGRHLKPSDGLLFIFLHTASMKITVPQADQGRRKILTGRLPPPAGGLHLIRLHPVTLVKTSAKVELGFRMPLFGRLPVPSHPVDLFFRHSEPKKITVPQSKLGIRIATFRLGLKSITEGQVRSLWESRTRENQKKNKTGIHATHRLDSTMKTILLASLFLTAAILPTNAQDRDEDRDNDRSSALTPTAQRPRNMANPEIPGWQAVPHGK